jgi:hypothetical protein
MNTQRRTSLLYLLTTIILLLIVLMLITDNNRKYSAALNDVMTVIARTNQAIIAPGETATSRALATSLPLTQTRSAQSP